MNKRPLIFVGVLVVFIAIGLAGSKDHTTTQGTTTPGPAQVTTPAPALTSPQPKKNIEWDGRKYTTVEGIPACVSDTKYNEFMGYFQQKENGPLTEMVETGECVLLKGGQKVLPVKHAGSMWDGRYLVEVRFVGTRQTAVLDAKYALAELQ